MLLCEKISVIRKMNNLTQEQFAEELSVSRQAVSKWESGDSVPDVRMLTRIADYCNMTLDQLVRDEYDLPFVGENEEKSSVGDTARLVEAERAIGKICDISMNSFMYSVIRNAEIVGISGDMVCFVKNRRIGFFNSKKSCGILVKKDGVGTYKNDSLLTGRCTVYINKGTYFGGMTYAFSEITEIKRDSIKILTGTFEAEQSLADVSVILMNQKAE